MNKLSVYIIAFNEEEKIEQALKSVEWADEVLVADSFSTDNTLEIAKKYGSRVIQVPFSGFGDLRNRAIEACSHEWIFSLDSDERCSQKTKEEILNIVHSENPHDAYYIPRKNYFMGKWIKYSGFYPDYRQPQLFKKGTLIFNHEMVHESYEVVSDKPCGYLKSHIYQVPFKNLEEVIHKANRYSTLGAQKLYKNDKKINIATALFHGLWAAFSLYILKLGFLDGWAGFIIALGNFEGTFYKYAKLYFIQKNFDVIPERLPDE